nr:MAG TPA: hypothetical protein [Caudoviricetes sp.]
MGAYKNPFSKEYYIFRRKTSGNAGCLFVYSKNNNRTKEGEVIGKQ